MPMCTAAIRKPDPAAAAKRHRARAAPFLPSRIPIARNAAIETTPTKSVSACPPPVASAAKITTAAVFRGVAFRARRRLDARSHGRNAKTFVWGWSAHTIAIPDPIATTPEKRAAGSREAAVDGLWFGGGLAVGVTL